MKTQNPISKKEMGFFFFRTKNQKVILDKDLSRLYGIETQALKWRNVSFWSALKKVKQRMASQGTFRMNVTA